MDFKNFICFLVLGFKHLQAEKKQINDTNPMTLQQILSATWLMYYIYDKDIAKEKAEKILDDLGIKYD